MQIDFENVKYAGFWSRFLAMLLDTIVQLLVLVPLLILIFGVDGLVANPEVMDSPLGYSLNYGFPILYVILFWKYKSATPGKIMMGMSIVDATTGGAPSMGRLIVRYLGYYLNILTCFIGFIWIGIDKRKQGLHDKLAGTVVIMNPPPATDSDP